MLAQGLNNTKAKELQKVAKKLGFQKVRQKGSPLVST